MYYVPGFVLEALNSQGHRLISCGTRALRRRKQASISTIQNETAPEVVPCTAEAADAAAVALVKHTARWGLHVWKGRRLTALGLPDSWEGSLCPVSLLGGYRNGQGQPIMSKDGLPPPFPSFWSCLHSFLVLQHPP